MPSDVFDTHIKTAGSLQARVKVEYIKQFTLQNYFKPVKSLESVPENFTFAEHLIYRYSREKFE